MVEMKLEENNRGVQRGGIDNDGFVPPREANMPPQRNGPKRDIIDSLCTNFNQDLLISKTFYFFFFLGLRVPLPPAGCLLQADGHERHTERIPNRSEAFRGVPGSSILGQHGR
ncbi:hypothetical protein CEXT_486351 [Caerostris extrusa]|uniref:Uncharacterized protein n=1 Tax=Caerostris extrusa TaxID=172846 RepID=A0AAV4RCH8_CAEEX|nr:hypothetical protein CEXT_486351 [Caerostris extrusa]